MTIWDDRILEFIEQKGSGSPVELEKSGFFQISRSQISRRLRRLKEKGMLQHLGNGIYVITPTGEEYLAGELNAEELSDTNEENGAASA